MFSKENVCAEIKDFAHSPITSDNVIIMACLLYIKAHSKELMTEGVESRQIGGDGLTKSQAMDWTSHMENADGTKGAHWPMEKTEEVRLQKGISCDPLEFYVAMNMIFSDYVKVAEKLGVNSMEFYACMAKAFLDDKDAQPDKLARYYWYIVEK